jgi:hypothetical protein
MEKIIEMLAGYLAGYSATSTSMAKDRREPPLIVIIVVILLLLSYRVGKTGFFLFVMPCY